MQAGRALLALTAALGMWIAARFIGSPTLHVVAVGILLLPIVAAWVGRRSGRRLVVRRWISDARISPGRRVTVEIEVANESPVSTSFLLLEDRLHTGLGRPARLVMAGIPAHRSQRVSYTLVPTLRGRYPIGPVLVWPADPYALIRRKIEFADIDHLVVTPEIELLGDSDDPRHGAGGGISRARRLLHTGEDFFTMRQYQTGDDLRRIHWPSVARTGDLMIRQDESTRRAWGVVFLDTRESAIGASRLPGFERAVSAAASIGVLLARSGFSVRLATTELPTLSVTEGALLDVLAAVAHHSTRVLTPALTRLRSEASADTTLVVVTGPPGPTELAALTRAGAAFGPKLAVLVYPVDPATLPPDRQATVEGRAGTARLSLSRAGWDVLILSPSTRLKDVWPTIKAPRSAVTG